MSGSEVTFEFGTPLRCTGFGAQSSAPPPARIRASHKPEKRSALLQRKLAQSASQIALNHTLARSDRDHPTKTGVNKLGEAERRAPFSSNAARRALG